LQITRNEAFRVMGRQRPAAGLEPVGSNVEDLAAPDESEMIIDRVDVRRALTELPPHERLLIELRYADDCSHPEIARKLEIPEVTSRVRLHRARRRLQALIGEVN
jgi:RNA polymerase sigma-70 factor (ECF subfamily)